MRAVFLAAIMVISVIGMSVAFTGAAAASLNNEAYNPSVPYQGQDVVYKNTTPGAVDEDETYELRQVNRFDSGQVDSSSFVKELDDIDATAGTITVETDTLEAGDYFIRGGELPFRPDEDDTFEIRIQSLDVEFDDDEVTDEGRDSTTELDIDSNRGTYSLVVDAGDGDLDNGELLDIFVSDENYDLATFNLTDGSIVFDTEPDAEITADDYRIILDKIAGVTFEDDDVTEPLLTTSATEIGEDVTLDSDDLADYDGGEFTIDATTTFGNLTNPSDDADVNPFNALLIAEDQDEEDDPDDRIVLLDIRDTEADIDFTDIDGGDYTFTFNVDDTEASSSADITVREEDQDASFSQGSYQAGVGDIAQFEFELEDTDEVWLQIGDADADFVDFLYVEVDDSDEPVEVAVNTRLLGAPGEIDEDAVYDVENTDSFRSLLHTNAGEVAGFEDFLSTTNADMFGDDDSPFSGAAGVVEFYDELDLVDEDDVAATTGEGVRDQMLTRPLQAIDYELQLASDSVDDDEAVFDSDAGAGEASDQLDSAVLELQAASIGDIRTWTAFEEDADDEDDVAELLEIVTERDEIAFEDRLVVQVEATGLYGGLIAGGPNDDDGVDNDAVDFDRLGEGLSTDIAVDFFDAENIEFDVESDTATGQDPLEVNLESDDSDTYMLIGPDQDQFFLIVDTGSDSAFSNGDAPEDGASFTVEFEYDADDGSDRFEFGDEPFENPEENYPYLRQGDTLSSSVGFDIEPREITFDNLNADDEVQAENIEDSVISGVTNIAPGSDGELRVSSTAATSSFREGVSVDIDEDGALSAEFDFDGQEPGDEFDTRFRAEGSTIDTVDSVIVAEGDLGIEDPVEDDEDDVADDEDDVVDDDDDVVDDDDDVVDDDDDVEDVDDETPGFGALVALVALIGAALLAARRQN